MSRVGEGTTAALARRLPAGVTARRPEWTRLLGVGMVGIAMLLAADPDYPVPRGNTQASAKAAPLLLPTALSPRGECGVEELEFTYRWSGPELDWELVVLDEQLEPVFSTPCPRRGPVPTPAALRERLEGGGVFYWFIRSAVDGLPIRSSPALFQPR